MGNNVTCLPLWGTPDGFTVEANNVRDEGLELLCVRFLQRISVLERVVGMKDGGVESIGEVWELMYLPDVVTNSRVAYQDSHHMC